MAARAEPVIYDDFPRDIFYGVSDNQNRFFDLEHAREVLNFEPSTWLFQLVRDHYTRPMNIKTRPF